jgi:putative Ca2+/H+ antiporter (TMEM165/GDT1 family)
MDWKLLGLSFVTVFLSELGDKSQLAAIALSTRCNSTRAVFVGSVAALLLTSFLGVWLGGSVAEFLPEKTVKAIAAVGFLVIAIRLLLFGEAKTCDEETASR